MNAGIGVNRGRLEHVKDYGNCPQCGAALKRRQKWCSSACYLKGRRSYAGEGNPRYKGGSCTQRGYVLVRVNGQTRYLHRVLMEQHLGRKLERHEIVHHINHDKTDNRIENLRVVALGEHSLYHNRKRGHCCESCGSRRSALHTLKGSPVFPLGLCGACYKRQWREKHRAPRPWAPRAGYESCADCGTTERRHLSGGRCSPCYYRDREKRRRAAAA